jgi:hypothetical protein
MTLATADEHGTPWASPVWFAQPDETTFLWVSDPDARHSRNIAANPTIALVIFDSNVTPGDAAALYVAAIAEQSNDGIEAYSQESLRQGLSAWTLADVSAPARHRLYKANATEMSTLGPGDRRVPHVGRT